MKYIQKYQNFGLMRLLFLLLILTICWTNFHCKTKSTAQEKADSINSNSASDSFDSLPNNFKEFYEKFHADSNFQIEHIIFPLEGLPELADPEFIGQDAFFWTADEWTFQNGKGLSDKNFQRSYLNLADILIEENIIDKKNQLKLIRRFAKTGDTWRLIYYAGMNKYKIRK